jgi:hypothetical protein
MTLLINPIAQPVQIGLYQDDRRIRSCVIEGQVSQTLLPKLMALMEEVSIEQIIYVNGPGSYMGIKLTYLMLRTLQIVRGISIGACSAFALNGGRPVRAMGRLYFVKEKETIITQKFDEPVPQAFGLPESLAAVPLEADIDPFYQLPAV